MCSFTVVTLTDDAFLSQCLETIIIDGFYVNCIEAKFIKKMTVLMIDGIINLSTPCYIDLQPSMKHSSIVKLPIPWDVPITKTTHRVWKRTKFKTPC